MRASATWPWVRFRPAGERRWTVVVLGTDVGVVELRAEESYWPSGRPRGVRSWWTPAGADGRYASRDAAVAALLGLELS